MSEAAAATPPLQAAPAKGRTSILVVLLVGLNVSLMVGAGVYVFMAQGSAPAPAGEHGGGAEGHDESDEERELGPLVDFDSMIVNTNDAEGEHYLKVTFQLEVESEERVEHVEGRMAPFRDRVLSHLSSLSSTDVGGPDRVPHLRGQLLELAASTFGEDAVRDIYFSELLVQ